MSLYTIDLSIKNLIDGLYDRVDENGELVAVTEEDLEALNQLQAERTTKLENIALYAKNLDAEAAAIKAEEKALEKRRKRLEAKSDGLRKLMIRSLTENNEKSFETARCSAKIRESKATEILDIGLIPEKYINIKTFEPERNPDKLAIRKAIEAGEDIAGAQIVINRKLNIE